MIVDVLKELRVGKVTVQGKKRLHEIELGNCSCGRKCRYVKKVEDLFAGKLRWELMSALHKEIRRGDVEKAMHWAEWIVKIMSEFALRGYLKGIVFEETRSLELARLVVGNSKRWREMVEKFCKVRKKWECRDDRDRFEREKEEGEWEWEELVLRDGRCRELFEMGFAEDWHAKRCAEEIAEGWWKEEWESEGEGSPEPDGKGVEDGLFLRRFEDYVFDVHVWYGKVRLLKEWKKGKIGPEKKMPDGCDLRWTGSVLGCVWRMLAFEQFGWEYWRKNWEEVKWENGMWEEAVREDKEWYPEFYEGLNESE